MRTSADSHEVFEGMHYVCFHYEFEHGPIDVDEECSAGGCPSAQVTPRPMRRPENVVALHDLARSLADRLTPEQQAGADVYLQVQEWALASEMFADWLAEDGLPVTAAEREVFLRLATLMGNDERIRSTLSHCPDPTQIHPDESQGTEPGSPFSSQRPN